MKIAIEGNELFVDKRFRSHLMFLMDLETIRKSIALKRISYADRFFLKLQEENNILAPDSVATTLNNLNTRILLLKQKNFVPYSALETIVIFNEMIFGKSCPFPLDYSIQPTKFEFFHNPLLLINYMEESHHAKATLISSTPLNDNINMEPIVSILKPNDLENYDGIAEYLTLLHNHTGSDVLNTFRNVSKLIWRDKIIGEHEKSAYFREYDYGIYYLGMFFKFGDTKIHSSYRSIASNITVATCRDIPCGQITENLSTVLFITSNTLNNPYPKIMLQKLKNLRLIIHADPIYSRLYVRHDYDSKSDIIETAAFISAINVDFMYHNGITSRYTIKLWSH
jgi:hypothetical protein